MATSGRIISVFLYFLINWVHASVPVRLSYMMSRCGGVIQVRSAFLLVTIDSQRYEPNTTCTLHVQAQPGHRLMFRIQSINISSSKKDSCDDYVEIRNGPTLTSKSISGRVCSTILWPPYTMTTSAEDAFVYFYSDNVMEGTGFKIAFIPFHTGVCLEGEFTCRNMRCVKQCDSYYDSCGDNSYRCSAYDDSYIYITIAVLATFFLLAVIISMCYCCFRDKRRRERRRRRREERRALRQIMAASAVSDGFLPNPPPGFPIPDDPAAASVPPYTPPAEPPPAYSTFPRRFTFSEDSLPKDSDETEQNGETEVTSQTEPPPQYAETSFSS